MKRILGLLLLLCLVALADPVKKSHVESELVSDQSVVAPGSTFWVAVRMKMDPEWHTYWEFPGDAGLPTQVTWTLPAGVTAGPLQFPVPERTNLQGLVSYSYEGEVFLLTQFQASPTLEPGPLELKAAVSYLACKEECIPGKADLVLALEAGAQSQPSPQAAALGEARRRLPLAGELTPRAYAENGSLFLTLPADTPKASFFPNSIEQIVLDGPQTVVGEALQLKPIDPAPQRLSGLLVVGEKAYAVDVPVGSKAEAAANPASPELAGFFPALLAAFLGGMILNLMPCVLPVLSIKILSFVESAGEERKHAWKHGALYTLGVLVSFWALTAVLLILKASGSAVGWGFQSQYPPVTLALAVLFLVIGLNLLGVFEIGVGLTRLNDVAERKSGLAGAFWGGVLATVAATPCTAPFMAGAIGFTATAPAYQTFLIFTSLGLGMALPYLLLASVPALLRFVPRPGAWMETFKQSMAFPMLLASVYLTWVLGKQLGVDAMATLLVAMVFFAIAAWAYGRFAFSVKPEVRFKGMGFAALMVALALAISVQALHEEPGARPGAETHGSWEPWSREKVAELRAAGKPVFVDFTAAWCVSCQANEKFALSPAEVQKAFQDRGITMLKADWTRYDETITRELASFGRIGVPLYVLYPAHGEPEILPQALTPSIVLKALEAIPLKSASAD